MTFDVEKVEGHTFVTVVCESLDASNAERLKANLDALDPGEHLVVDLHKVAFMDSSGLGALVVCLRRALSKGGDLSVCAPRPAVRVLFEVVQAHQIFSIYNNRAEALRTRRRPQQRIAAR
jgi:anti-sigma B factor antagonist